jgi:hypothetical protein
MNETSCGNKEGQMRLPFNRFALRVSHRWLSRILGDKYDYSATFD